MKKTNNRQLDDLIGQYSLSRKQVAGLLRVNISTVDRWLVPATHNGHKNTTYRAMPDMAIELLYLKVKLRLYDA